MFGSRNVSQEDKLKAVKEYLVGNEPSHSISRKYGVTRSSFRKWVGNYETFGDNAFIRTGHNARYTKELKEAVVRACLNGEGALQDIAIISANERGRRENVYSDWCKSSPKI